jgi:LysM repeat protein
VQYLFLDRRIQRLLYDYALSRGADRAYLDNLFGNGNFRNGMIHHVPRHYDHMHVRFYAPWSTMAARLGEEDGQKRTVIEMAQQAYLPKKVNYYVKGNERSVEALAQSFGVNQKDFCRWNQMHLNDVLTPGSCVVFYKRGFEVEPVNLARSLQPDSIQDSPSPQLASARGVGSASDAPTSLRGVNAKGRNLALSSTPIYTVSRGDTLVKVAKQTGTDLKVLCALNGLKPTAGVKPGQKIKLASSNATSRKTDVAKPQTVKSVHEVSLADPKASSGFVPAVYTAEKQDTLSKIAKQQGIDLNTLCQINGLKKNTTLKPGQKIRLLEADVSPKRNASPAVNGPVPPSSKHSTSGSNTLQANMKPLRDSKSKAGSSSPQKQEGIQKTSAKTSTGGSGAQAVKTTNNARKKPRN